MVSRKAFRLAALLSAALLLSAVTGLGCKKEGPAAPEKEPAPAAAAPAATPEPKPAEEAKPKPPEEKKPSAAEKRAALKERAEKTYRAVYCAVQVGQPEAADKAYKDHEFKSPSHFHRLWKRLADKEPAWAKSVVAATDEKSCEKKK